MEGIDRQDTGASANADRATAAEPVVSALRDGIPSAFDVNNPVWFKLTEFGEQIRRKNHNDLNALTNGNLGEYRPSNGGWVKMQMWALMQEFGPHIRVGFEAPFKTTIYLRNPAQAIEAGTAKTEGLGPKDESAVTK